ncbi:hypothetical protein CWI66_08380 [Halomonas sp. 141]|uniref:hypothetical protein n=1 Tax=unclassified Halomonas TaxID=2609666 RepID=UPI000C2ABC6F|nr:MULTISPECIES: hypothetical protein [unclassified Halomonas]PJX14115.1 hypothetical protein CWI66_08380 [Halomonas sp. 141]
MKSNSTTISALYVVNELIPKLNAVEKRVELTIGSATARESVPMGIERMTRLQAEFQLELTMIRLNLAHLLKRYQAVLEAAMQDPANDQLLTLDAYEATAIASAKQLYERVQQLQKGD